MSLLFDSKGFPSSSTTHLQKSRSKVDRAGPNNFPVSLLAKGMSGLELRIPPQYAAALALYNAQQARARAGEAAIAAKAAEHRVQFERAYAGYARCLDTCEGETGDAARCHAGCWVAQTHRSPAAEAGFDLDSERRAGWRQPAAYPPSMTAKHCKAATSAAECQAGEQCEWVTGLGCGQRVVGPDGVATVVYEIADPATVSMTSAGNPIIMH